MRNEQGFSMIKMMFWGAIIASGVVYAYMIIPVYNAYWKVQDTFDGVVNSMSDSTESAIRRRLPDLFKIQYLAAGEVPQEFYDDLTIKAEDGKVEISSYYHVTVWFIGPVEGVNPNSKYDEADLKGMDKLRAKLRQDFDFDVYAKTP
ncbi:MAG: DUF4845 domain-containing protein [Mariprofundaceae bacterium]|nr:DUF4845 domain-containing protein [Mariprofundaceae bacterium]